MALVGPLSFHYLKPCAIVALVLAIIDVVSFVAIPLGTGLADIPLLSIAVVVLCLGILIP